MVVVEVRETPDKRWGLYVNGALIGDSRYRFDADHAKAVLERALSQEEGCSRD